MDIEQRSSLVAALRAKLTRNADSAPSIAPPSPDTGGFDVAATDPYSQPYEEIAAPQPMLSPEVEDAFEAPPAAPDSFTTGFSDVMAKMDRGLDARQKLINALKAQLSKSAALPKTAPPASPPSVQAQAPWAPAPAPILEQAPPTMSFPTAFAPPSNGMLEVTPMLRPAPLMVLSPSPAPEMLAAYPALLELSGMNGEPAAKRPRTSLDDGAFPPPGGGAQADALAARKAAMLRNLGGAPGAQGPPGGGPASPSQPSASAAPGMPPQQPPPSVGPECPQGTSPEEFEAYRQQCWKQYYDYTSVWQKYYEQEKQSGQPAQSKAKGCGKGCGKGAMPPQQGGLLPAMAMNPAFAQSSPSSPPTLPSSFFGTAAAGGRPPWQPSPGGAGLPGAGTMVSPITMAMAARGGAMMGGYARPPALVKPMDEDIHSKLLGL